MELKPLKAEESKKVAEAIVIGASSGAVDALAAILPKLPNDFPLPVVIVVHLPAENKSSLPALFNAKCQMTVQEAEDKELLQKGTVYFAPPDYHLLIEEDKRLSLSSEEPVHYSRPAIDVLFESAADAYGPALIAVILTGANEDGAQGLKSVHDVGGTALIQRPDQASAAAMPLAALDACPEAMLLSLDQIATFLCTFGGAR